MSYVCLWDIKFIPTTGGKVSVNKIHEWMVGLKNAIDEYDLWFDKPVPDDLGDNEKYRKYLLQMTQTDRADIWIECHTDDGIINLASDSESGVEAGADLVWAALNEFDLPDRVIFSYMYGDTRANDNGGGVCLVTKAERKYIPMDSLWEIAERHNMIDWTANA